jgi:hypothetical protein
MKHYTNPELAASIFYPLSIYDDTAHTALYSLKSKYLYEEIKAEYLICLMSIAKTIADKAFYPIWCYIAIQNLPPEVINKTDKQFQEIISKKS